MKGVVSLLLALGLLVAGDPLTVGRTKVEVDDHAGLYRVAREGREWSDWLKQSTRLHLKLKALDPLDASEGLEERYSSLLPVPGLQSLFEKPAGFPAPYLVQLRTQALQDIQEHLVKDLGVKLLFHFPSQAVLVSVPSEAALEAVRSFPLVRWVGSYSPLYKLGADVASLLATRDNFNVRLNVMLVERGPALQEQLAGFVESLGGRTPVKVGEGFRVEVVLKKRLVPRLLERPEVLYADLWTAPDTDMNIARMSGGLEYVTQVEGFNGQGVRAEVMDSGLYTAHGDFKSLNVMIHGGNGASTSHGSSVFGVVFGDGAGDGMALGGLSGAEASIFAAYSLLGGSYTRYRHTAELVDPEGAYRAVFQTNSWGDSQTTAYTTVSAEMDDIIFLNDLLILQSQSNTGSRTSRPQAWAKNILSVGAFYHYDTLTRDDDRWNRGASIGPAEDGRQKPDLSSYYDSILTTSNMNGSYTQFGGTSGATPITAGHTGIMFQMWASGVFSGEFGAAGRRAQDVFDARPHSSTSKALMINTAEQFPFDSSSTDLIRVHQGWGTPNVATLYDVAKIHRWSLPLLVDETEPVGPLEVVTFSLTIGAASAPTYLKVTLTYRDPMPAVSASKQLINNLDLRVQTPSGRIFWGNHGLSEGPCSTSGGEPSDVDNVENVFICDAEAGTYTVSVYGTEIVYDTNPETEALDAVFSLVATKGKNY